MSEAGYKVTHLDQIPEPAVEKEAGDPDWHAVRIHFGIQSFGVNVYTAVQEGQRLVVVAQGREGSPGR